MGADFHWDPNAGRNIKRQVVRNLTPRFRQAVEATVCPDHGQPARLVQEQESWRIEGCCEKVVHTATEAAGGTLR
jgi:hypothetical protein